MRAPCAHPSCVPETTNSLSIEAPDFTADLPERIAGLKLIYSFKTKESNSAIF